MNRRNFLRGLFGVAAAAMAAPVMKFVPEPRIPIPYYDKAAVEAFNRNFVLCHPDAYADYISFSDMALASAIDPLVENAANQLAGRQLACFKRAMRRERYLAKQYRRRAKAVCIQRSLAACA